MCIPSAPEPVKAPPVPPPPPPPQATAQKVEQAPQLRSAEQLAARLGTASLQIPYTAINVPRP